MYKLRPVSMVDTPIRSPRDIVHNIFVDDTITAETLKEVVDSLFRKYGKKHILMVTDRYIGLRHKEINPEVIRTITFEFHETITPSDIVYLQSNGFDYVRYI